MILLGPWAPGKEDRWQWLIRTGGEGEVPGSSVDLSTGGLFMFFFQAMYGVRVADYRIVLRREYWAQPFDSQEPKHQHQGNDGLPQGLAIQGWWPTPEEDVPVLSLPDPASLHGPQEMMKSSKPYIRSTGRAGTWSETRSDIIIVGVKDWDCCCCCGCSQQHRSGLTEWGPKKASLSCVHVRSRCCPCWQLGFSRHISYCVDSVVSLSVEPRERDRERERERRKENKKPSL